MDLSPGTFVHTGGKETLRIRITVIDFDEVYFQEREIKTIEESFLFKDKARMTWINTDGVHDADIIEKIGNHFDLHPLISEDIVNTEQPPKNEEKILVARGNHKLRADDNLIRYGSFTEMRQIA